MYSNSSLGPTKPTNPELVRTLRLHVEHNRKLYEDLLTSEQTVTIPVSEHNLVLVIENHPNHLIPNEIPRLLADIERAIQRGIDQEEEVINGWMEEETHVWTWELAVHHHALREQMLDKLTLTYHPVYSWRRAIMRWFTRFGNRLIKRLRIAS